jgi:hypothetical protein
LQNKVAEVEAKSAPHGNAPSLNGEEAQSVVLLKTEGSEAAPPDAVTKLAQEPVTQDEVKSSVGKVRALYIIV